MNEILKWNNKSNKNNLYSIITISLAFILLLLWHRHLIFMDETDNMLGALAIAHGKDIYSGFYSQHTPFVYYFFSIFAFLGVKEYETFRLCMSATILLIWLIIYFSNRKHFGEKAILISILLYPLTLSLHWGHMILSDVFQGFSLLILMLELIKYWETKQLSLQNYILIASSVFISIMSAFLSVYPVFVIFIGFLVHEIMFNKRIDDYKIKLKSYLLLIGIATIPFLILILWYLLTHNLRNFYFQAYEFNRVYYSKYLSGFGSSGLSVIKGTLVGWINYITSSLTKFTIDTLISSILVIFNLLFLKEMLKKGHILTLIIFIFIAFTGMRGYSGTHGIPYYIVSFLCVGYITNKYLLSKENVLIEYKKILLQLLIFFLFLLSFNSYIPFAGDNFFKAKGYMVSDPLDRYVQTLTTKSDTVWFSNPVPQSYIKNNREPASRVYGLVPWFADAFSNEVISDLSKNKPKLITFVSEEEVWGHKFKDFAASIYTFIQQDYKVLNQSDPIEKNIYIRNDYYEEAISKLWETADKLGLKNGMLVYDSESKVYLIEDNMKRYVASQEAFKNNGYIWINPKEIDDGILSKIKSGKQIE